MFSNKDISSIFSCVVIVPLMLHAMSLDAVEYGLYIDDQAKEIRPCSQVGYVMSRSV